MNTRPSFRPRPACAGHRPSRAAQLALVLAMGAVAACGGTPPEGQAAPGEPAVPGEAAPPVTDPAATADVTDVYWKLTELDGQAAVGGDAEPERAPHIRLGTDSRVTGSTGCNSISGPYTLSADQLDFGMLVTTRMACTDPARSGQEQNFVQALETTDRFTVEGDRLTLYAGEQAVVIFTATAGG